MYNYFFSFFIYSFLLPTHNPYTGGQVYLFHFQVEFNTLIKASLKPPTTYPNTMIHRQTNKETHRLNETQQVQVDQQTD